MDSSTSAVSRCPVEIWIVIIRWAACAHPYIFTPTRVPERGYSACLSRRGRDGARPGVGEGQADGGYGDERRYLDLKPVEVPTTHRLALPVPLSLMLVCRSWHDIAEPHLYETLSIKHDEFPRARKILRALSKSRQGHFAGDWVRRLHITQSGPWSDDLSGRREMLEGEQREWISNIATLIGYCSRLSEFVWDVRHISVYDIIPALAISCAETLSLLILDQTAMVRGRFAALASQFPHLQNLSVGVIDTRDRPASPLVTDPARFQHLHALSVSSHDRDAFFQDFLSHLRLPELRHVDVTYDWSLQFSPHFFQAHGSKLKSLSLDVGPPRDTYALPPENAGLVASLLDYCPNLEELVFDLHTSVERPSKPLPKLRLLALKSLVCHLHIASQRHVDAVKSAFSIFVSSNFPAVELIRCVDVIARPHWIHPYPYHSHTLWKLDDNYVQLLEFIRESCATRDIRLEDCVGGSMTKDMEIEPLHPPLGLRGMYPLV